VDDQGGHAEQIALSDDGDQVPSHRRSDSPLQPDLTRSRFSSDSDSSSYISDDDSDYDSHGNEIFRLRLPVASPLAQRRYLDRGEDLRCVSREQRFQLEHEVDCRNGKVTEPGELFREINWNQQSSTEKIEDVSPRTVPQAPRAPCRGSAAVPLEGTSECLESQVEASRQTQNDEIHT
jgi:hypothetical protein